MTSKHKAMESAKGVSWRGSLADMQRIKRQKEQSKADPYQHTNKSIYRHTHRARQKVGEAGAKGYMPYRRES